MPLLLTTMPMAGLRHPLVAAGAGAVWVVVRNCRLKIVTLYRHLKEFFN